jgi:hypothetical protein
MEVFTGLISGTQFADENWNTRSNRRKIFHDYPGGEFPLTGLLSLLEPDWTDSPEFGWYEKRWYDPETELSAGTTVPFTVAGSSTSLGAEVDFTANLLVRVYVDDKTIFRERQVIRIEDLPITGGTKKDLVLVIESIVGGSDQAIEGRVVTAVDNVINTTNLIDGGTPGPVNAPVAIIGTANAEGSTSVGGILIAPFKVENNTQIFKNPFSVTGTALVTPTDWDARGTYPELAQDNLIRHMVDMENAFLWGQKSVTTVMDDGEEVPRRTMGGVKWFLEEYEKANSIYRGGTGAPVMDSNDDEDKRIIYASSGSVNASDFFGTYMERLFRCTSNRGYEKLCLCGSGVLGALETYLKSHGGIQTNKGMKAETAWGWNVYTVETTYGTVHFKSHPLFQRNRRRRFDALFLDVGNLKYRPLNKRDTKKFKGRQNPDADKRKDLWQTECSLELRQPQSHMLMRNIRTIANA